MKRKSGRVRRIGEEGKEKQIILSPLPIPESPLDWDQGRVPPQPIPAAPLGSSKTCTPGAPALLPSAPTQSGNAWLPGQPGSRLSAPPAWGRGHWPADPPLVLSRQNPSSKMPLLGVGFTGWRWEFCCVFGWGALPSGSFFGGAGDDLS